MLSHVPLRVNVVPEELVASPGETVALSVTVYNGTPIIDGFKVTVVGANQADVHTEPDWVSLFPESEQTVRVTVAIPPGFPSGRHHFGIKVTSMTDHSVVWVGGVDITIAEQGSAALVIDPESTPPTKEGRFGLTITNTGNKLLNFGFTGDDAENHLTYTFRPDALEVPPGESASVQLLVSGDRPFTGTAEARPFTVGATAADMTHEVAAMISLKPIVPRLALILAGMALMFALWALVIGAAIDSIVDDSDEDVSAAFEEGMESVVAAVAPEALAGAEAAGGGGVAGAIDEDGNAADLTTVGDGTAGDGTGGDGTSTDDGGAGDPVTILESTVTAPVVSASNSEPLPSATATLFALFDAGSRQGTVDLNREPIEVSADETGRFTAEDVPRGLYRLIVGAVGYLNSMCDVTVPFRTSSIDACGTTTSTTGQEAIFLRAHDSSVSGLVTVQGDAAAGINVAIRRLRETDGMSIDSSGQLAEQFAQPVTTGADGRWTFPITADDPFSATPGTYEIEASGTGLRTNRVILDVPAGEHILGIELPLVISVQGNGSLTGSVSAGSPSSNPPSGQGETSDGSAASTPILGAQVTSGPLGGVAITVEGDGVSFSGTSLSAAASGRAIGSFEINLLPVGDFTATFAKEGFETQSLAFTISDTASTAVLNVTMVPLPGTITGSVSGSVTDAAGDPLGGVLVTVSGSETALTTTTLTAGSIGSYTLAGLQPGTLTATFSKDGYTTQSQSFTITNTATSATVNAQLPWIPVPITGLVFGLDSSGATTPLPGVTVSIDSGDTLTAVAVSDGDGAFSTTPQALPASYDLHFALTGFGSVTASKTVSEPLDNVLGTPVILPELVATTFQLVDESGFAPFPLPLDVGTPAEPTVAFSVTSVTESTVSALADMTLPIVGSVTDSTATVTVPVGTIVETELFVTPGVDDSFVPFDTEAMTQTVDVSSHLASAETILVYFDPGAIYGTRGLCNDDPNAPDITLDGVEPWLLNNGRYLFNGYDTGDYALSVSFGFFDQTVTLDGARPATNIDLDPFCNEIPG